MRHREPYCWKCTSSIAQRSTFGLMLNLWSFFMHPLNFRVSVGDQGPRFAQPEAELPEHPLALANAQVDVEVLLHPSTQGLPVPKGSRQAHLTGSVAEHGINLLPLLFTQPPGPPGSVSFQQPGQTSFFQAMHPILHRAPAIAQQSRHLGTSHPLSYQQYPVQPMIVTRIFRTTDLILKSQHHSFGIANLQWFHVLMKPQLLTMRNYLCRYV